MPQAAFDTEAFYAALDSQRQAMRMTWKDVAAEAEISASTLTRMGQGKRPDVDGLAALLKWSGLQAEMFIRKNSQEARRKPETLAQISALLRADTTLSKESAEAVDTILKAAYKRLREE